MSTYEQLYYDANRELNDKDKLLAASQQREAELRETNEAIREVNANLCSDLADLRTTSEKLLQSEREMRMKLILALNRETQLKQERDAAQISARDSQRLLNEINHDLSNVTQERDRLRAVVDAWVLFINKQSSIVMPERVTREYLAKQALAEGKE